MRYAVMSWIYAAKLDDEVDGIVLTEEVLSKQDVDPLLIWCEEQPSWSDMPIVVLSKKEAESSLG